MMYGDAIPAGFGDPNLSRMETPLMESNHVSNNNNSNSNNKRTSAASIYASAAKSNAPVAFDEKTATSKTTSEHRQPHPLSVSMPVTKEGLKEAAAASSSTSSSSSTSNNMSASLNLNPEQPVPLHLQTASNQQQQTGHFGTVAVPPLRAGSSQKPIRPYFKVPDYGQFRLQREMLLTKSLNTPAYTRPASRPFIPWRILGCVLKKPLNSNTSGTNIANKADNNKIDKILDKSEEKEEKEEDILYFVVNTDAGLYCDRYALKYPYHRFEVRTTNNHIEKSLHSIIVFTLTMNVHRQPLHQEANHHRS